MISLPTRSNTRPTPGRRARPAWRRGLAALAAVAACAGAAAAAAPQVPLDPLVEPLISREMIRQLKLSPDGACVAALGSYWNGRRTVELIDSMTGVRRSMPAQSMVPASGNKPAHVRSPKAIDWIDDATLAVDFDDDTAMAIGKDGTTIAALGVRFMGMVKADGDTRKSAIVVSDAADGRLARVSLPGGQMQPLVLAIPDVRVMTWLVDDAGVIRLVRSLHRAVAGQQTMIDTWYRAGEDAAWTKFRADPVADDDFDPILVADKPEHLVVRARNGRDTTAVWDYDIRQNAFVDLMAGSASDDIVSVETAGSAKEFAAVATDGLKPTTLWLDPHMAGIQATVDAALPQHINVVQRSRSTNYLIRSYSDLEPSRYFVLNIEERRLREIAVRDVKPDPARQQPMQTLRYASFDGTSIPAYLTVPKDAHGRMPLIVLIHGGPQARDYWEWNTDVQVFAAHGYAVFQPQFRGSRGFGSKFEAAGFGQWGQAMQDDITAGVRTLIDRNIADPSRICIIGGSYGGYAALWGLAKTPDLYKCGVSMSGVSDISLMLHDDSDSSQDPINREFMARRIGNPNLMTLEWDAVSPLKHADAIKAPLLIVHGALDKRVPIVHGSSMRRAMLAANKDVEWLEFPDEGHGIAKLDNLRRYYAAVFQLLGRTIGGGVVGRVTSNER